MDYPNLERNLKALQQFYPSFVEGKPRRVQPEALDGLPVWVKGAMVLYELPLLGSAGPSLYFALPEGDMPFEHLLRIYLQVAAKLKGPLLLVADELPAKHRPLLVKFKVAFIYKDKSVYAPELGLKFDKIGRFQESRKLDLENKREALTPFALKLVAGLLTNQIPEEFTLKFLFEMLMRANVGFSMSKISVTLAELADHGLVLATGAGPTRMFTKNSVEKTWSKLLALPLAPFFRESRSNHVPKDRSLYCISGESALAHYSNLGEPPISTIAMSTKSFREVYQDSKDAIPYEDFGKASVIQIWKERPQLFSIDGVLNPIEVFFSTRGHRDERVQMALDEMIKPYGLERRNS